MAKPHGPIVAPTFLGSLFLTIIQVFKGMVYAFIYGWVRGPIILVLPLFLGPC